MSHTKGETWMICDDSTGENLGQMLLLAPPKEGYPFNVGPASDGHHDFTVLSIDQAKRMVMLKRVKPA